nr:MAG TPA: hypothetical protein [Caudoviricetes sp.]
MLNITPFKQGSIGLSWAIVYAYPCTENSFHFHSHQSYSFS